MERKQSRRTARTSFPLLSNRFCGERRDDPKDSSIQSRHVIPLFRQGCILATCDVFNLSPHFPIHLDTHSPRECTRNCVALLTFIRLSDGQLQQIQSAFSYAAFQLQADSGVFAFVEYWINRGIKEMKLVEQNLSKFAVLPLQCDSDSSSRSIFL